MSAISRRKTLASTYATLDRLYSQTGHDIATRELVACIGRLADVVQELEQLSLTDVDRQLLAEADGTATDTRPHVSYSASVRGN